jgi:transcriptional regulator with XRE-family HTH domain
VSNQFGQVIREKRISLGYTQEELAEMVGRSTGQIGQIERGETAPSVDVLEKLIDVLSIDPRLLFMEYAVSNELQDTMVMLGKLEPNMQEIISDFVRLAYTKMRKKGK